MRDASCSSSPRPGASRRARPARRSYLRNALDSISEGAPLTDVDLEFLAAETGTDRVYVAEVIDGLR